MDSEPKQAPTPKSNGSSSKPSSKWSKPRHPRRHGQKRAVDTPISFEYLHGPAPLPKSGISTYKEFVQAVKQTAADRTEAAKLAKKKVRDELASARDRHRSIYVASSSRAGVGPARSSSTVMVPTQMARYVPRTTNRHRMVPVDAGPAAMSLKSKSKPKRDKISMRTYLKKKGGPKPFTIDPELLHGNIASDPNYEKYVEDERLFGQYLGQTGFISKVSKLLVQLYQRNIFPEPIEEYLALMIREQMGNGAPSKAELEDQDLEALQTERDGWADKVKSLETENESLRTECAALGISIIKQTQPKNSTKRSKKIATTAAALESATSSMMSLDPRPPTDSKKKASYFRGQSVGEFSTAADSEVTIVGPMTKIEASSPAFALARVRDEDDGGRHRGTTHRSPSQLLADLRKNPIQKTLPSFQVPWGASGGAGGAGGRAESPSGIGQEKDPLHPANLFKIPKKAHKR